MALRRLLIVGNQSLRPSLPAFSLSLPRQSSRPAVLLPNRRAMAALAYTTPKDQLLDVVDLVPGRRLTDGDHPLQAHCAATPVVTSLDPKCYSSAICTHSGGFHCDEALAIGMLKLLPEFQNSVVVRSRSSEVHDACSIVVDVGGIHDHSKRRYDHHQRSFNSEFEDVTLGADTGFKTKLSACGLVYKYYGKKIVNVIREACGAPEETPELADKIWKRVYAGFVEHVDGIDNGIKAFAGGEPNYNVSTTLSSRVGSLNPAWNEPSSNEVRNAQFQKAMMLTQREFIEKVEGLYKSWLPARQIVERAVLANIDAYKKRAAPDSASAADSRILVLDEFCPWIDHMFDLEEEHGIKGRFIYCIFPDSSGGARVRAVPDEPGSFGNRKALPEPWRGVRDADLSSLIGIEGAVFVHNSGFIGGNKTFEGALQMARVAVDYVNEQKQ